MALAAGSVMMQIGREAAGIAQTAHPSAPPWILLIGADDRNRNHGDGSTSGWGCGDGRASGHHLRGSILLN